MQAATAPRERGWRWYLLALVAVVAITMAPVWPPALALLAAFFRLLFPFEQVALLAFVAMAACTMLGWWAGGRVGVALLSVVLAAWMLAKIPLPVEGYGAFVRGWSVALAASFGLVSLAAGQRPFLGRAVGAVALTFVVWETGVAVSNSGPTLFSNSVQMLDGDYERRLTESLELWKGRTASGAWQAFAARLPQVAARADGVAARLETLAGDDEARSGSWLVLLSPALLALESVLALALAWTSYHRLTRVRIGPPLGTLRDVRFSDQLVWGLVLGATVALLPTFEQWRVAGLNLLCFFGALYALRGVGILSWWIADRVALFALPVLVVLVSLLGPTLVLATVAVVALAVGLSDTWRDFRLAARAR
jgi:hypothetical protein